MTSLGALGRRQTAALDEFRGSEEAGLLTRLAQTECLLEIAKLSSQRVDLSSYAGMVVGIITQFVPSIACAVSIDVDDVPPILSSYGTLDDVLPPGGRHQLRLDDIQVGELVVVAEVSQPSTAEFLATIAGQISGGLSNLVEAERLRRRAAVSQAFLLIDALSDQPSNEALRDLVGALALLPNVLGARLDVDHASLPGATTVTAGTPPLERGTTVEVPGGEFNLAMRWSASVGARESESLGEIVDMLAAAFAKAEERRRLRDEAETDPLTGIGNRRRALRALVEAVDLAESTEGTVGVIYLDLDHFKKVNDTLGDEVLVIFAGHLKNAVRDRDTVTRFGGEEFLLVCPGLDESSGASLLRRILDTTPVACSTPLPPGWRQTASAGIACYPNVANHPDALVRAADQALYAAKSGGRDQFRSAERPTPSRANDPR